MNPLARLIDGRAIAASVRSDVRAHVAELAERRVKPGLAVVLVGEDPASQVYVRNKDKAALEAGFAVRTRRMSASTTQAALEAEVRALNADASVHGILVQLPLPPPLDANRIVELIDPQKDVDGLHPHNVAALMLGRAGLAPCTPRGCIELLDRSSIAIEGRHAVVLGRSMLVGKPLALMCLARNATVTIAHSRTQDLPSIARSADILFAAVGRARLVEAAWVRPGAVVIDVGINRLADGKLAGDVDFERVREVAAAITPVPGGVGPMTIAMLLENTLLAAARQTVGESVLAAARDPASLPRRR